jgi:hypothetical protein
MLRSRVVRKPVERAAGRRDWILLTAADIEIDGELM